MKSTKGSVIILILIGLCIAFTGHGYARYFDVEVKAQNLPTLQQQLAEIKEENAQLKQKLEAKVQVEEKIAKSPEPKAKALKAALETWGIEHLEAFENLVTKESNFNPFALNKKSGACGMFQAHPCSKMKSTDLDYQISWGINYIKSRYGNPTNAWKHWLSKKPIDGRDVGHWY